MFSFLDDKELYGGASPQAPAARGASFGAPSANDGTSGARDSGFALRQSSPRASRGEAAGAGAAPPEAAAAEPPLAALLFKSLSLMDQRLLSLEERLVGALERLASEARRGGLSQPCSGQSWWTYCLSVMASTVLALILIRFLWRGGPAGQSSFAAGPLATASSMPMRRAADASSFAASPSATPLFFAAPNSFLQWSSLPPR